MKAPPNTGNDIYNNPWSSINSFEVIRRAFAISNNTNETKKENQLKSFPSPGLHENVFCECLTHLDKNLCHG